MAAARPGMLDQPATVAAPRAGARRWLLDRGAHLGATVLFAALAVPAGLFLVFAVPPVQGLDELNHFYRAYSISGGALVTPVVDGRAGDFLPACVRGYGMDLLDRATRPGHFRPGEYLVEPSGCAERPDAFVRFDNAALYSPVAYLPQSIGVAAARGVGAPVPAQFYAGRIAALLAYVGLVGLALALAPRGRAVLLAVALMPASLLLGTQYSADGMTIALALLLVGAVVRCCWSPRATWRTVVLAAGAAAALALSKSTYFVLAPLLLLVPSRLLGRPWTGRLAKLGAVGVIAALTAAWSLQVREIDATRGATLGVDPAQQVRFVLDHPLRYARFVLLTLFGPQTGYFTWQGFVSWVGFSRTLTAGLPSPPPLIMAAGIGMLALAYAREAPRTVALSAASVARAALPAVLAAANAVLIVTALYLFVMPVGWETLWLQGRYLLPLAAVPVISLHALGTGEHRERPLAPLVPLLLLLLAYLVGKVLVYFYR